MMVIHFSLRNTCIGWFYYMKTSCSAPIGIHEQSVVESHYVEAKNENNVAVMCIYYKDMMTITG